MSYYQYQAQSPPHPLPPQRSYTTGPQPSHSHSHSVPNAYPNAPYNAYPPNQPAAGSAYPQSAPHLQHPTTPVRGPSASGHGFMPLSQPHFQQPQQQQPYPPARTPSPFRRPLPSPQRTDPIPRSLTPGLSSPTSPPTSSFSSNPSAFSLNSTSSLGFTSASSGNVNSSAAVRTHSHSYSMSDAMQKGPPGSLPSPYPPNWSPSHQAHQQQPQQYQPPTQPQYQPPPPQQPQQQYSRSQPTPYTPRAPQRPQTAYAAMFGGTPPQLPPITTGANMPSSSIFPPAQSLSGPGPANASPTQAGPNHIVQSNNSLPTTTTAVRTYSQPLSSGTSTPPGNSSPTRRPLPTPGPNSRTPGPSSAFPDRAYTRSPSPVKAPVPPARSQSPVKAIRDMFEAKNAHLNNADIQRAGQQQSLQMSGALVLHGKGWSEDSDNGAIESDGAGKERGRSGFAGISSGGRRASPPKFFGNIERDDAGGAVESKQEAATVKLVSSGPAFNSSSSMGAGLGMSASAAYNALPPAPLNSQQDGGTKFVPLWKRGRTFTFDNAPPNRNTGPNNTSTPPQATLNSRHGSIDLRPGMNIAGVGAGENAAAKGRVLPQPEAASSRPNSQSLSQSQISQSLAQTPQRPAQQQRQYRAPEVQQSQSQLQQRPQQSPSQTQPRSRSQGPASTQPQGQAQSQPQTRSQSRSIVQLQSESQFQSTPSRSRQPQPESAQIREPPIRSQPLKQPADNFQPDPRRSRAQPQRHTRSRSHGPPSAHQSPQHQPRHQQQNSEPPLLRGAPPGWKTTVNIPSQPPSPPVMGMKNRSHSVGPPSRGQASPSASRSGSPTKNVRAPNGWRTTVSPNAKHPPPDVDPRTGEVFPPRHKPPEGWRSSVSKPPPQHPKSQPGSPKKKGKAKEPEIASRAPGGWRSTVDANNTPSAPVSARGGGAPGWRATAYSKATSERGSGISTQKEQKRWSQPVGNMTPRASARSGYGYSQSQYYSEGDQGGDSSLEYDSTDAYGGLYEDEEGDSSFDASTTNGTTATGDEETDRSSMLSRDTGYTESSAAESYDSDYERARAQLPHSPQYGIRELPKKNTDPFVEAGVRGSKSIPRSPQYGIRDIPASALGGRASNPRSVVSEGVGRLPRPPAMSRGGTSEGGTPEPFSRPLSTTSRSSGMGFASGSDVGSEVGSRRNSAFSTTSSKGEWPVGIPPLPRAPGSASRSSFGSEVGGRDESRLAEQRRRREREMFDLDDAPPVGVSTLRRTPSPGAVSSIDDYESGGHSFNFSRQAPQQHPESLSRPSTSHSNSSRSPSQEQHSSVVRPLPHPSQLQRAQSQRSQAASQHPTVPSVPSTPSSYAPPLPPRQASPTRSAPHRQVMPQIEIQSPAPISGWDRTDLPKIEVNDGPEADSGSVPAIAVSAPSISVSGFDDDDDDGMGPMISVSGPDDNADKPEGNNPAATRPLPPLHRGGGLICGGCGGAIVGRIVSAMELRWHPECFRCTVCEELLEHVSSYEHEGRPYCHLDYHENFAPRCYSCKTAIIEERYISLDDPALGKRTYHEQHFFCAECGDPFLAPSSERRNAQGGEMGVSVSGDGEFLLDDDVGFTVYKGHPYCEACHVRLRMPKCKKCKKSIRDGMQAVEALGGKWCYECFVCAGCEQPFDDPSFFQRGDKPFCERCFSIILRNEL